MPSPEDIVANIVANMQPILDSCSQKTNGVDDIAFLYGYTIVAQSKTIGGSGKNVDMSDVASMYDSFEKSVKGTLSPSAILKTISFLKQEVYDDNSVVNEGWTLTSIQVKDLRFTLAFAGNLTSEDQYGLHQTTAINYCKKLLNFVVEYAECI